MRTWCLVLAVALGAVACSGDDASSELDPGPLAEELSSSVPTSSTTTTTLRPPVPTDPPPLPEAMIGDLVIPCSPVGRSVVAEQPGVTADAIVIGTGSDRGGIATPGAGLGIIEMIETLADHCNANGGLHGREVRVLEYDAAAAEAAERVAAACDEVVALVGHAFLQLAEETLTALECGLDRYPAADGLVPATPVNLHAHLSAAFTDPTAASIALVGPDTPTGQAERNRHRAAIEAVGGPLTVVADLGYAIDRQTDWDRLVGEARFSGAGQVHIVGGCDHAIRPFVDVADAAGWEPVIVGTAAAYDPACLDIPTTERLLVEIPFLPFEDGDAAPATSEHAALIDRIAAPRTGNGLLAASAFWRWAADSAACLADDDPECAAPVDDVGWTAGGLHTPVSADGSTGGCTVVLGVEDGAFVRRLPVEAGAYSCDPAFSSMPPDADGREEEAG